MVVYRHFQVPTLVFSCANLALSKCAVRAAPLVGALTSSFLLFFSKAPIFLKRCWRRGGHAANTAIASTSRATVLWKRRISSNLDKRKRKFWNGISGADSKYNFYLSNLNITSEIAQNQPGTCYPCSTQAPENSKPSKLQIVLQTKKKERK